MATQTHKKWTSWLVIGIVTLVIISLAYLVLKPGKDSQLSKNPEKQELSNSTSQQASAFEGQPLNEVLKVLAKQYEVAITIDNPYMENCPFPSLQTGRSLQDILNALSKQFKMEIHEAAPKEYILIGGICN